MNAAQWRELADEYYELARQNDRAGNSDAARYWRHAADACREEARRLDADRKTQQGSEQ